MGKIDDEPANPKPFAHIPFPKGITIVKEKFRFNGEEEDRLFLNFSRYSLDFDGFENIVETNINERYLDLKTEIDQLPSISNSYTNYLIDKFTRFHKYSITNPIPINPDSLTFEFFTRKLLAEKIIAANPKINTKQISQGDSNVKIEFDPKLLEETLKETNNQSTKKIADDATISEVIGVLEAKNTKEVLTMLISPRKITIEV